MIATGFSAEAKSARPAPKSERVAAASSRQLDLPTFLREKKKKTEETQVTPPVSIQREDDLHLDDDIDDLDIPTFLRKQMD